MSAGSHDSLFSSPLGKCLSVALLPLSWLYGVGLSVYLLPYKLGIRKRYRLPCRVICVGNLTFGGTGKSPAVRAVCERLLERGFHPAILSRGHGGRLSSTGAIVSDKQKRLIDAVDCGDEPALLADSLPGVPVAIGKDRRKIGRVLFERFSPDVIVLDDGMQYWQLHRDAEIVLVNAERPFGTGRLLPSGDLREPIRGIRRADAVVITGTEATAPERVDSVRNDLAERVPWVEVFTAKRRPSALVNSNTGERLPVERLQGMPVVAVSGIARPWSFETMLRDCGADVRQRVRFGDHCAYAKGEIDAISAALEKTGAEAVVTTAKDAVKLRLQTKMYVMEIELVVEDIDRLIDIAIGTGLETQVGSSQA